MYSKELEEDKYIVVEGLIPEQIYELAKHYYEIKFLVRNDYFTTIDTFEPEVVKPYAIKDYADPFTESLLAYLTPAMRDITGKDLIPTYTYIRYYQNGNYLIEHDDRDSCEYSVTLPMVVDGTPWEIYMDKQPLDIKIGQAVVYKGCEIKHSRPPFEGEYQVQAHLHWVENNFKNQSIAYDTRRTIGLTVEKFEKRKNINYA